MVSRDVDGCAYFDSSRWDDLASRDSARALFLLSTASLMLGHFGPGTLGHRLGWDASYIAVNDIYFP